MQEKKWKKCMSVKNTHLLDNGQRIVRHHGAGEEELGSKQSLVSPQTGQAGVELLPHVAHPAQGLLQQALGVPGTALHLGVGGCVT